MYDEEQYQYQPRPRSPVPAAIVTSVVTSLVMFFVLKVFEDRLPFGKPKVVGPDSVEVPSLLGLNQQQARELLEGRRLLFSISGEKEDSKYPGGTIASQMPLPGSQVRTGTPVQAVVSRGLGQLQVPNLVGLRVEDAARQLVSAGLQSGPPKQAPSAQVAAGLVAQTEPAAGSPVAPQTPVTLVISSGAPSRSVPKVTGMRLAAAKKLLEEAGFKVGKLRYIVDADRVGGIVLQQTPAIGTEAPPGTGVDLLINDD